MRVGLQYRYTIPILYVFRLYFAAKFTPEVDAETVKDEFEELQLLEDDAVVTVVDDAVVNVLDHVWGDVMAMQTGMGAVRFLALTTVYTALLGLPHSGNGASGKCTCPRKPGYITSDG